MTTEFRSEFHTDDNRPYYSYGAYCRLIFGRPMQKLPVAAGFTCPNRDGSKGTGGCTFCRNDAFTPGYCDARLPIGRQLDAAISFYQRRIRPETGFLAYFQPFSNTHAPLERLERLYNEALSHPQINGLVIATRPDCVDKQKLDFLAELARHIYLCIEYGLESTSDATLQAINRGHDFETARKAVEETARRGIPVGGHFILGLPDETGEMLLDRVRIINSLPLTTVKFHQLQILAGPPMAALYEQQPRRFPQWTPESYVDLLAEMVRRLRPDIVLERIVNQVPPRFLTQKAWGGLRSGELWRLLEKRLREKGAHQGDFLYLCTGDSPRGSLRR